MGSWNNKVIWYGISEENGACILGVCTNQQASTQQISPMTDFEKICLQLKTQWECVFSK
jgi:hypothetical protein